MNSRITKLILTPGLPGQSRSLLKNFLCTLLVCVSVSATGNAHAYFVRPFIQVGGGGFIDGFEENGKTKGSLSFAGVVQTEVDLAAGTVGSSVDITGSGQSAQGGGSFGETVTFENAAGTNVDFSFAYDGIIDVTNYNFSGSTLFTSVFVNLAVFDPGVADFTNFNILDGAHIQESIFLNFSSETSDYTKIIDDALTGSFTVGANSTFDVFAGLSVAVSTNSNPSTVSMDFLNTGAFGIATEPGVTFTSASGVFLNPSQVPIPATLPLMISSLLGLGFFAKRNRSQS